jgi:hypothetical protein
MIRGHSPSLYPVVMAFRWPLDHSCHRFIGSMRVVGNLKGKFLRATACGACHLSRIVNAPYEWAAKL